MIPNLIYLYCLADRVSQLNPSGKRSLPINLSPKGSGFGLGIDNAYFIYHQGLYAMVCRVLPGEFSRESLEKNLADLEWVKTKASIHEKVIEEVMKNSCVVPFKFATLFKTEDNLKAMLSQYAKVFKKSLKHLSNKEEWGLKIYCDRDKLKKNLSQEDREFFNLDKEIRTSSPGKAFLLKKKKEELVYTLVDKKLNEFSKVCFERLKQNSAQSRINKLLPREVTEKKEDMILNSAFLVDKKIVNVFVGAVDNLKAQYADKGLWFNCTGPWPAYNFCSLEGVLTDE